MNINFWNHCTKNLYCRKGKICKGIFHSVKGIFPMNDVTVNFLYVITAPQKYMQKRLLLLSCFSRIRLCNPIDSSPRGSPVPGTLQARTLEWVAISFSNAWKWKVKVKSLSRVWLLTTPWTAAFQAPPSMGFSRQEYWSGLLVLYRGDNAYCKGMR